ncbi:hypothetical protein N658DRAFT_501338 [Parathielavia hyrcaniae]|uniref:Uncharacterized protein n=1 Tax=Parathielavia hyrcaniae TaxID=113614 RepID=A0AAN6PRK1_9PEZI|nr:hypothetical protein N658DRAFT_501338 [Parathielavia hyrcaniae]
MAAYTSSKVLYVFSGGGGPQGRSGACDDDSAASILSDKLGGSRPLIGSRRLMMLQ